MYSEVGDSENANCFLFMLPKDGNFHIVNHSHKIKVNGGMCESFFLSSAITASIHQDDTSSDELKICASSLYRFTLRLVSTLVAVVPFEIHRFSALFYRYQRWQFDYIPLVRFFLDYRRIVDIDNVFFSVFKVIVDALFGCSEIQCIYCVYIALHNV